MHYIGTVKYIKEDENGKVKKVSEQYLIEALSFAEAEINFYKFLEEAIPDFSVKTLTESGINDVFEYEEDKDAVRFQVTPKNSRDFSERMRINVNPVDENTAVVEFMWGNMSWSFNVKPQPNQG